jgi:hypothetical protein
VAVNLERSDKWKYAIGPTNSASPMLPCIFATHLTADKQARAQLGHHPERSADDTIAVRNVAEPKGIHNPSAVEEWKAKASLTGNKSYHIAKIAGEARKTPDPPDKYRLVGPPGRAGVGPRQW